MALDPLTINNLWGGAGHFLGGMAVGVAIYRAFKRVLDNHERRIRRLESNAGLEALEPTPSTEVSFGDFVPVLSGGNRRADD